MKAHSSAPPIPAPADLCLLHPECTCPTLTPHVAPVQHSQPGHTRMRGSWPAGHNQGCLFFENFDSFASESGAAEKDVWGQSGSTNSDLTTQEEAWGADGILSSQRPAEGFLTFPPATFSNPGLYHAAEACSVRQGKWDTPKLGNCTSKAAALHKSTCSVCAWFSVL